MYMEPKLLYNGIHTVIHHSTSHSHIGEIAIWGLWYKN